MKSTVSIVRCQTYEEEEILKSLRRSIDLLGGIQNFVKRGDSVLLKPNLLYGKAPEKAVTTHPTIVKGMIGMVRAAGGIPFIGDSPSIGSVARAAKKAGIKQVADENDCPLIGFEKPILPPKGGGKFFKRLEVEQKVLEADVVINLPKWKTHEMTLLTLGVKNLFGCVPGSQKALWHLKAGKDRKLFAQILIDLYQVIQPSLTVLDGVVGMEGNGPGSGNPIQLGLILASSDALSLDQIVCDLLRIPRKSLLTNQVAFEEGMGKDEIEIVGERLKEIRIPDFALPAPSSPNWNLPGFLQKALKNALTSKPVAEEEVCKACNRCVEICPPGALEREERGLMFDYEKCIRCFCCQEVCPEGAISIKRGWALNLYNQIRSTKSEIRNKFK
jgi:uncharacterized protein (DUF362 family)/Pyruvate/2-oxoacid:ferredoxin oxidoreductase delta subunit